MRVATSLTQLRWGITRQSARDDTLVLNLHRKRLKADHLRVATTQAALSQSAVTTCRRDLVRLYQTVGLTARARAMEANMAVLSPQHSIGPRLREITIQYTPKRGVDGRPVHLGPRVTHALAAAHVLARVLAHEPAEVFGVLCLTARARIIGWHEVSRGTLNRVRVQTREVFHAAVLSNAASVILAHNHPSGEADPSLGDLHLTRRLIKAGMLVGIDIVDHIIIGDGEFASVRAVTPHGDTHGPYEGLPDVIGRTWLNGGLMWTKAPFAIEAEMQISA